MHDVPLQRRFVQENAGARHTWGRIKYVLDLILGDLLLGAYANIACVAVGKRRLPRLFANNPVQGVDAVHMLLQRSSQ